MTRKGCYGRGILAFERFEPARRPGEKLSSSKIAKASGQSNAATQGLFVVIVCKSLPLYFYVVGYFQVLFLLTNLIQIFVIGYHHDLIKFRFFRLLLQR